MRRYFAWLALCLSLGACGRFTGNEGPVKNVSGLIPDLEFTMTDDAGRAVDAGTFRGAPVLLYFGFTHCPDVCPTTLALLANATRAARQEKVHILFVTVDAPRDSVAQLARYVRGFGKNVTGLRGTPAQLDRLARRYRVSYSAEAPDARGDYEVNHSSGVFAFDAQGRARLLILSAASTSQVKAALPGLAAPR